MSASNPTTIRPDALPGFHALGRRTGSSNDLAGKEFLTHCPPDIPPRSRVVALLTVTDRDDLASPSEDGWFVSDFYLFYHLLSPSQGFFTNNQVWLTCEPPDALVAKYQEYTHGDAEGERRVVLDAQLLRKINTDGILRPVSRKDLLERFVSTLREQGRMAQQNHEHLVVLIFGHGTSTCGVPVGGDGKPEDDPMLYMKDLRRAVPPGVATTLIITSCYSGGWLVHPNITRPDQGPSLNITGITAADPWGESSSWAKSGSVGRAGGSLAVSAITQCLIDAEQEVQQSTDHPTYAQLAKSIFEAVDNFGLLGKSQEIYFSAQDDEWEMHYQTRLGLPLASYRDRWLALRSIPPSSTPATASTPTVAKSGGRQIRRLHVLAQEYFASKPGRDELGPNVGLHYCLRWLHKREWTTQKLDLLTRTVTYRLGTMHEAEYLRKQMGLDYPSIFDVETSRPKFASKEQESLYGRIWYLLITKEISTPPRGVQLEYNKPIEYLSLALVHSGLSWEEIGAKVDFAVQQKRAWYQWVYKAWLGNKVAREEGVIASLRAFREALKTLAHRG